MAADLAGLRAAGLEEPIRRHAEQGKWMLGVCGGLQMLGTDILDPSHMESAEERTPGLGLLELSTTRRRQNPAQRAPGKHAAGPSRGGL
ncbi:MAG: hypothetical protein ACLT8E_08640 [Akkermansia sp.]